MSQVRLNYLVDLILIIHKYVYNMYNIYMHMYVLKVIHHKYLSHILYYTFDIYRTVHPKTMNFTFFSSAHGTLSRIDHILGHKSSLGKFKKIKIIPSIFSDHSAVRLDLNYRRKTIKNSTYGG